MRETMKRVHDGAIGDIVAMQASYNTGPLGVHARAGLVRHGIPECADRYYYAWLSGDFNVEQHIPQPRQDRPWARKKTSTQSRRLAWAGGR